MKTETISFQIPQIETERLILRGHQTSDFESLAGMWAHPIVVQHITGVPSTESQSWVRLLNYTGHWAHMGFGYWAVVEKSSGQYIGDVGLADFKRDIQPSMKGLHEMGWILSPHVHGKGYAVEAVQAVIAWGKSNLKTDRFVCIIAPKNEASIRLAQKVGFQEITRTTFMGGPTVMYELKFATV